MYFLKAQLIRTRFTFVEPRSAVSRTFFQYPMFRDVEFSGEVKGGIGRIELSPGERTNPQFNPVRLRNATLDARTLKNLAPDRVFADGSVTLSGAARPAHWCDQVLSDEDYEAAYWAFVSALAQRPWDEGTDADPVN